MPEGARLAKIAPMFDKFENFERGSIKNKILSPAFPTIPSLQLFKGNYLFNVVSLADKPCQKNWRRSLGFLLRLYSDG